MMAEYGIAELAKELGVSHRTLRFYEQEGIVLPRRDGVTRFYSEEDRLKLDYICRGRKLGVSLAAIRAGLVQGVDAWAHLIEAAKTRASVLHAELATVEAGIIELKHKAVGNER